MTLQIIVHDVGHGQAIHAFTPNGGTVVIDLGCSADHSPLEWLSEYTKCIDSLVITHPHGDHIDELLLIKSLNLKVRQLWRPNWLNEDIVRKQNQASYTKKLDEYFSMSSRYNSAINTDNLVGNPKVSGGVSIKKFSSKNCGVSSINNHSGVVVFEYCGVTVVVPGDNEPPSWRELMKQPDFAKIMKNANVFMASHHGRESGYSADIFAEKPNLCIVSDGRMQDTDATQRYSYHARGWDILSRSSKSSKKRNCLTTRTDGHLEIKIGKNSNGKGYLSVTSN